MMKTIQMTIDDDLLAEVDRATETLQTNRSAFIRSALQLALRQHRIEQLEHQHAAGYASTPVAPNEFDLWQAEQQWDAE
jgi:metal-responsive CopG/Arc/MetJ family transcriptional regulator